MGFEQKCCNGCKDKCSLDAKESPIFERWVPCISDKEQWSHKKASYTDAVKMAETISKQCAKYSR
jgi:hypothetical protein